MPSERLSQVRRVAVSSLIGTSMEWYEYFVYGTLAALVFNELFFPEFDPQVGTIAAFLTFAVGFIARPIGGIVFGHLGDKIGRRNTLIVTIVTIGGATGCIGLLPTYDSIGFAAPVLLAALRFIQGLSLGGEWSGAVLMAVEHAPEDRRAFYGSMPQFGSPIGTLASSGMVAAITLMPHDQLVAWGWRIPFLIAFPFLIIAIYLRLRVEESPLFRQVQRERREVKLPLLEVLRSAGGRMVISIAASMFASGAFFLMTTYAVNYGTATLKLSASILLTATLIGAVLEGLGIWVSGRLADRHTPWKIVAAGGALCVLAAFPLSAMIRTGSPALVIVGVAVGIGLLGVPYGPFGTLLSQLFADETRYSAIAVSYNIAGMIGGFVPSAALALSRSFEDSVWVIGVLFGAICAITTIGAICAGAVLKRNESAAAYTLAEA